MSCEKYKSTLIEAAVSGGESPRVTGLRTHVESCAACAADLSQQRALVDAMEVNLHRQMNAPVPAGMLRRLEAHLAQQPQKMRKPRLTLIFASTVATLAIAAVVVLLLPHKGSRTVDEKRTIPPAANFVADESRIDTNPPAKTEKIAPMHTVRLRRVVAKPTEPEVLVPPDERIALAHYIANSGEGPQLVAALTKPLYRNDQPVKHIEIPNINTPGIVIEPIAEARR